MGIFYGLYHVADMVSPTVCVLCFISCVQESRGVLTDQMSLRSANPFNCLPASGGGKQAAVYIYIKREGWVGLHWRPSVKVG